MLTTLFLSDLVTAASYLLGRLLMTWNEDLNFIHVLLELIEVLALLLELLL